MAAPGPSSDTPTNPLMEIVQPFIDLVKAPRALWGINLAYVLEGMVYFGMLGYLAIHFSDFIFAGVDKADIWSHNMVMVLTAGITISMFFLGFIADKYGVRKAILIAFVFMLAGRIVISGAATVFGLETGLWGSMHLVTMGGILLVVIGYGLYQPAAYAAVRQFTTPKTAAMGFAMLYALMNLGGWLPTFAFLLRDDNFAGLGIPGTYWVYTGFTLLAVVLTFLILTPKTVEDAIATAKAETERIKDEEDAKKTDAERKADAKAAADAQPADRGERVPLHMLLTFVVILGIILWKAWGVVGWTTAGAVLVAGIVVAVLPGDAGARARRFLANHPLGDVKFFYFIFALIPVQTLFVYNWLVLPQYISRAFEGVIGEYFEVAANANPILIFIAVPLIAAATRKAPVYRMMIIGTIVMAAPAFLLVIGPKPWVLFAYILVMTIGEAMWQPRFLQYAAEIAPEGRTGEYMGVAQLPWFLTKVLVPLLYSGWMLDRYCPAEGPQNTQFMWLIFAIIAMMSPVLLILARNWIGKDFKTQA